MVCMGTVLGGRGCTCGEPEVGPPGYTCPYCKSEQARKVESDRRWEEKRRHDDYQEQWVPKHLRTPYRSEQEDVYTQYTPPQPQPQPRSTPSKLIIDPRIEPMSDEKWVEIYTRAKNRDTCHAVQDRVLLAKEVLILRSQLKQAKSMLKLVKKG